MEEINITELLQYYLKKIHIIIIITLLTLLLGAFYIKRIQVPLYHGTTTIILVQKSEDNQSANATQNELNVNERLVTTYSQIIKSRRVLDQVIKELNLDMTYETLHNLVSVSALNNTEIIKITVVNLDGKMAKNIANVTANYFADEVVDLYNMNNVNILDEAIESSKPYNINVVKQVIIYFMVGFIIAAGILFVIYYFDRTIKSVEQVEQKIKLPILGSVEIFEGGSKK